MIRKTRQNSGLSKLMDSVPFVDTTDSAEFTFQVYDFPDRFYLGKNSFKILANSNNLESNSSIVIDIEDNQGNPIYYEITNIINRDRSRTIVVYIYEDTPIGYVNVYIGSTLKRNLLSGDELNTDGVNVIWTKKVLVSTSKKSFDPIIFSNPPTIVFQERHENRRIFSTTSSRFINDENRGSGEVSLISKNSSYDLASGHQVRDIDLSSKVLQTVPEINTGIGTYSGPKRIPQYLETSILTSANFSFTGSMVGGIMTVRNIDISSSAPLDSLPSITTPDYSASILRVLNKNTIELYPPFQYSTTYVSNGQLTTYTTNKFFGETNFTASWLSPLNSVSSSTSQSFLQMEFQGLEPDVGYVDYIQVLYKRVGDYGNFFDLGRFKVDTFPNILVDPNTLEITENGLSEKRIGYPQPGDLKDFIITASFYGISGSAGFNISDTRIQNSYEIVHPLITDSASYVSAYFTDSYKPIVIKDSTYEFRFLCSNTTTSSFATPQLDVYISGSKILSDVGKLKKNQLPLLSGINAEYVGTIITDNESYKEFSIIFEALETSPITPLFVVRSGQWTVGQIEINTINEPGFSPNHAKIFVPLPEQTFNQELLFEVRYLNEKNEPSDLVQKLSGIYFQGSQPDTTIEQITNNTVTYDSLRSGSSVWNRVGVRNGSFELSYSSSIGESSAVEYITQTNWSSNSGGQSALVTIPINRDNINDTAYTGSKNFAGLAYTIETVIFGKTGSFGALRDTNLWASTIQGRIIVSDKDNNGAPLAYTTLVISGSGERIYGTYGNGPSSKSNLDSWYKIGSVTATGDGVILVTHRIFTTSSFFWDFYLTSKTTVIKIDGRY